MVDESETAPSGVGEGVGCWVFDFSITESYCYTVSGPGGLERALQHLESMMEQKYGRRVQFQNLKIRRGIRE